VKGVLMNEDSGYVYSYSEDNLILRWDFSEENLIFNTPKKLCVLDGPVRSLKILKITSNSIFLVAIEIRNDINNPDISDELILLKDTISSNSSENEDINFCQIHRYSTPNQ
jgi:hypothetical protein